MDIAAFGVSSLGKDRGSHWFGLAEMVTSHLNAAPTFCNHKLVPDAVGTEHPCAIEASGKLVAEGIRASYNQNKGYPPT